MTAPAQSLSIAPAARGPRTFWQSFRERRLAVAGLAIITFAVAVAIFAPVLAPRGPLHLYDDTLSPPTAEHPLGTDKLGRDVLAIMIWGTRVSLAFALGVAGISLMLGIVLGAIPGYLGGWVDDAFSRFYEVFLMIPRFFLIILVVAIFGQNIAFTMVIVGLTAWVTNARLTRAQVYSIKERVFVKVSMASGASAVSVMVHHILPNGLYPVIANSTLEMAGAIVTEAALSFLGLGDPNNVSWGQLLHVAQEQLRAWWLAVFPGLAIFLLVLAFNLVGDGVSYALNPRLRRSR